MTPYYDEDGITIYHGEALRVLSDLPHQSADVLMTDPPYSSGGMFRSDRTADTAAKYAQPMYNGSKRVALDYGSFSGDSRDQRSWTAWVGAWMWQAAQICRSHAFVFSDWRQLPAASDALQAGGWLWRGVVAWDKGDGSGLPRRGFFRTNIEFVLWGTASLVHNEVDAFPGSVITAPLRTVAGGNKLHPTQKPELLLSHLLGIVNPTPGLVVLDPFMGSGSTLVAAKQLGLKAIGIEIEERYCEIAVQRLAQGVLDFEPATSEGAT